MTFQEFVISNFGVLKKGPHRQDEKQACVIEAWTAIQGKF